ncbi:hypothetical protein [Streptosporangium sp. NPDC002607]
MPSLVGEESDGLAEAVADGPRADVPDLVAPASDRDALTERIGRRMVTL